MHGLVDYVLRFSTCSIHSLHTHLIGTQIIRWQLLSLPFTMVALYLPQSYRGQNVRSILIPLPSILVLALAAPAGSNILYMDWCFSSFLLS